MYGRNWRTTLRKTRICRDYPEFCLTLESFLTQNIPSGIVTPPEIVKIGLRRVKREMTSTERQVSEERIVRCCRDMILHIRGQPRDKVFAEVVSTALVRVHLNVILK